MTAIIMSNEEATMEKACRKLKVGYIPPEPGAPHDQEVARIQTLRKRIADARGKQFLSAKLSNFSKEQREKERRRQKAQTAIKHGIEDLRRRQSLIAASAQQANYALLPASMQQNYATAAMSVPAVISQPVSMPNSAGLPHFGAASNVARRAPSTEAASLAASLTAIQSSASRHAAISRPLSLDELVLMRRASLGQHSIPSLNSNYTLESQMQQNPAVLDNFLRSHLAARVAASELLRVRSPVNASVPVGPGTVPPGSPTGLEVKVSARDSIEALDISEQSERSTTRPKKRYKNNDDDMTLDISEQSGRSTSTLLNYWRRPDDCSLPLDTSEQSERSADLPKKLRKNDQGDSTLDIGVQPGRSTAPRNENKRKKG